VVCVACGAVDDIRLSNAVEAALQRLVGEVTKSAAFVAEGHSLEIEGRCRRCA
jgi:Fe2+ or Zn2+ uptake regulation protein